MTDDTTAGEPAPEAAPEPRRIEAGPERAAAEPEAAAGGTGTDCGTCEGTREVGGAPCPACLSLVPPPAPRHAAPGLPRPEVLASKLSRECEACGARESRSIPMYDAGYALYCASSGDCARRQDRAKPAKASAA